METCLGAHRIVKIPVQAGHADSSFIKEFKQATYRCLCGSVVHNLHMFDAMDATTGILMFCITLFPANGMVNLDFKKGIKYSVLVE